METQKEKREFSHLQELQNHHTNPKTSFEAESKILFHESWPQIQALLHRLIHKEVERKIHTLFPFLPLSPRCFACPNFDAESITITKRTIESWTEIKAILGPVVHKKVESEFRNQLNDWIGEKANVALGTVKEFQGAPSDIMDLKKHYLVENDAMEGGAHEENVEVDEPTSQL